MTPEAYEAMRVALEQLIREGGIYRHFEFQPAAVAITKAWRENARELFQARLTATLRDYVGDGFSGEMASWGWLEPVHAVEEWTFVREAGGLWRVAAVA
jgi:predicted lipid-binding transport protein (Tim44 family)